MKRSFAILTGLLFLLSVTAVFAQNYGSSSNQSSRSSNAAVSQGSRSMSSTQRTRRHRMARGTRRMLMRQAMRGACPPGCVSVSRAHRVARALCPTGGPASVVINGRTATLSAPPRLVQGQVLVPVRSIVEALGGSVQWEQTGRTVAIQHAGQNFSLSTSRFGGMVASAGAGGASLPARLYNDTAYVPLSFIRDQLGAQVSWDRNNCALTIAAAQPIVSMAPPATPSAPPQAATPRFTCPPEVQSGVPDSAAQTPTAPGAIGSTDSSGLGAGAAGTDSTSNLGAAAPGGTTDQGTLPDSTTQAPSDAY